MRTSRHMRALLGMAAALLVVSCDDDSNSNTQRIGLEVTPPSISVMAGGTGRASAFVTRSAALTEPVELSVSTVPTGLTVAFVPQLVPDGSFGARIDVTVAETVAPGTYDMTVRADAPDAEQGTHPFEVIVVAPSGGFDFRPARDPLRVSPGGPPDTTSLLIARTAPFTGPVTFQAVNVPAGLTVTVTPSQAEGTSATLSVAAAPSLTASTLSFELRGTAAGQPDVVHVVDVIVYDVGPLGGLTLGIDPQQLTVTAGGPAATATVFITRSGSFTGPVDVWVWDEPGTGITATVTPELNITGTTTQLSVQAAADVPPGTYAMSLFGSNSGTGWAIVQDFLWVGITVVAGT